MRSEGVQEEYQGEFWIANDLERKARGRLSRKRGTNAVVRLDAPLRDGPQLGTPSVLDGGGVAIAYRAHTPTESVSSFQPVTLHGKLDDGTLVSGLAAQNHGGDGEMGMMPQYHLRFLLWGTHALDDTMFSAARFRVYGSELMTRLRAEPDAVHSVTHPGLEGTLAPLLDDDDIWLVYRADSPVGLRQATDSVANACLLFLDVVLDLEFRLRDVQLESEGNWVSVISPRLWETPDWLTSETLMPPETITIGRLAAFIDLHNRLDALTDPIAHPLEKGAIQARLLVNSSVVEGVHRRLWSDRKRFALPPNTSIKKVRREAKSAGVESFVSQGITDDATAEKCLNDALRHLDEISFADRVRDVVEEVSTALPEVFESIPNYADILVGARNELAHHLPDDETRVETLTQKIDRWAALDYATPWAMRALILLRSGVTQWEIACSFVGDDVLPESAEHRYPGYPRFQISRQNVRQIARELGWVE